MYLYIKKILDIYLFYLLASLWCLLLLTLRIFHTLFYCSTINYEQVNAGWEILDKSIRNVSTKLDLFNSSCHAYKNLKRASLSKMSFPKTA